MKAVLIDCRLRSILGLAVACALPWSALGQGADLDQLPMAREFEAHRITSYDAKGGNEDWRDLEPGGTLVLADIQGPGCIVHLRDNITSQEPHHLQSHVLRIYWDGETEPSVEAPVGDFFGIGFGFTEKLNSALVCIDQRPQCNCSQQQHEWEDHPRVGLLQMLLHGGAKLRTTQERVNFQSAR